MLENLNNIEKEILNNDKTCCFYASDYHFEMISLPYIKNQLDDNNNVIILTENDLVDSIQKVLHNTNLKEENRKKIFEINWDNNKDDKLKQLHNHNFKNQTTTIFIKGQKEYIKNMNLYLEKNMNLSNVKIVDCYSIYDINNNVSNITKNYNYVLNTIGKINL